MEFLMTYGWAILIMLAVVAIMFMLGVFNPKTALPNTCILPSGISCYGYQVAEGGLLTLQLAQSTGKDIRITRLGCSASDTPSLTTLASPVLIPNGRHVDISNYVTCTKANGAVPGVGEYYAGTLYIVYLDEETGLSHYIKGDIAYKVEAPTSATPVPTATPSPTATATPTPTETPTPIPTPTPECATDVDCGVREFCDGGTCSACSYNLCGAGACGGENTYFCEPGVHCLVDNDCMSSSAPQGQGQYCDQGTGLCTVCGAGTCPDGTNCFDRGDSICSSGHCVNTNPSCSSSSCVEKCGTPSENGWFYGLVGDDFGARLGGQTVYATDLGTSDVYSNSSGIGSAYDSAGRYWIYGLPPGSYSLAVSGYSYYGDWTDSPYTIGAGAGTQADISLTPNGAGGYFHGTVTDDLGSPIPDARIEMTGPDHWYVFADSSGSYNSIELTPGSYTVEVTASGYTFTGTSPQTKSLVPAPGTLANFQADAPPVPCPGAGQTEITACGTISQAGSRRVLCHDISAAMSPCITISGSNIELDGNGHSLTATGALSYGIRITGTGANVHGFGSISGFGSAIYVTGTYSVVRDNVITSASDYGIYVRGDYAVVDDNDVTVSGDRGISFEHGADDGTATNNHIHPGARNGIVVDGTNRCLITGNTIDGPTTAEGILCHNTHGSSFNTNTINDAGTYGIKCGGPTNSIVIDGNHINSPGSVGVKYDGGGSPNITLNVITDSGMEGIDFGGGGQARIIGNHVTNAGNDCIAAGGGGNSIVDGNILSTCAGDGIRGSGGSDLTITNNQVSGSTGYDLVCGSAGGHDVRSGNTCLSAQKCDNCNTPPACSISACN